MIVLFKACDHKANNNQSFLLFSSSLLFYFILFFEKMKVCKDSLVFLTVFLFGILKVLFLHRVLPTSLLCLCFPTQIPSTLPPHTSVALAGWLEILLSAQRKSGLFKYSFFFFSFLDFLDDFYSLSVGIVF